MNLRVSWGERRGIIGGIGKESYREENHRGIKGELIGERRGLSIILKSITMIKAINNIVSVLKVLIIILQVVLKLMIL